MAALTEVQLKAATNAAKNDIKILKRNGTMAINNSKQGALSLSFDNSLFEILAIGSTVTFLFSTKCEKALINFLVNDIYII